MRYYFRVYVKGIFPKLVYTSELYDDRAEAEKAAESCNDQDHTAFVETYHPMEKPRCFENAEDFCIGDYE